MVSFVLCLLRLFHSYTHMIRGLYYSAFFISQLIDRADRKLFNQIQLSHHCLKLSSFKLSPSLFQVFTWIQRTPVLLAPIKHSFV